MTAHWTADLVGLHETCPRLWILGAPDPEMETIERLLVATGEYVVYAATYPDLTRVRPHEAYRDDLTVIPCPGSRPWPGAGADPIASATIVTVECAIPAGIGMENAIRIAIDHHQPGDPGYGRPPEEFLQASSLGQVLAELAQLDLILIVGHIPQEYLLVAAADHCLAAAYRNECPGVDPDTLMKWRVTSRAMFQRRPESAILADIESTRAALRHAPKIRLRGPADMPHDRDHDWSRSVCDGCAVADVFACDMRREPPWPELPEAAAREGVGYVSGPLIGPDGRRKYTCAGTPNQVRAWMEHWAPSAGLVDIYGDPARGFAGGVQP